MAVLTPRRSAASSAPRREAVFEPGKEPIELAARRALQESPWRGIRRGKRLQGAAHAGEDLRHPPVRQACRHKTDDLLVEGRGERVDQLQGSG